MYLRISVKTAHSALPESGMTFLCINTTISWKKVPLMRPDYKLQDDKYNSKHSSMVKLERKRSLTCSTVEHDN